MFKKGSPNSIALYVALICSTIVTVFTIIAMWLMGISIQFSILGTIAILCFASVFLILRYYINQFIYEKIKLIYKTIHDLKLGQKKTLKQKLEEGVDVIEGVNREVVEWAEDREKEIDSLKKMEAYRREFIGNLAHELKTPIFNIQGYIGTLLEEWSNEELKEQDKELQVRYLRNADKNIERMISLIEDLDTVSRLESGDMPLYLERFNIVSLAQDVMDMLEKRAQDKNIHLQLKENYNPIYTIGDQNTIRQVFTNLLVNSIIYGNEKGLTKVSFFDMGENVLVEVSDNGPGIAEENLPRLFERFYRIDKSRSRNSGGTGLGLAIVKHIIEAHKQTIHVRSAMGKGSTFSFTLKKA